MTTQFLQRFLDQYSTFFCRIAFSFGLLSFLSAFPSPLSAATYYVSPGDNLVTAVNSLSAGDTLLLRDGIYHDRLVFSGAHSGLPGQPIEVRAENDGAVYLDGTGVANGGYLVVDGASYIEIAGLTLRNPSDTTVSRPFPVRIEGGAHHIALKRLIAIGKPGGAGNIILLHNSVHDVLLEDCASWGNGAYNLFIEQTCSNVTVRRFYGRFQGWDGDLPPDYPAWLLNIEVYGGHNTLIENFVGRAVPHLPLAQHDTSLLFAGTGQRLLGSVILEEGNTGLCMTGSQGGRWKDVVLIHSEGPLGIQVNKSRDPFNFNVEDNRIENFSWIYQQADMEPTAIRLSKSDPSARGNVTVQNSFFQGNGSVWALAKADSADALGTLAHSDNAFWGIPPSRWYYNLSAGPNETAVDPGWDTATYGLGAYLMASRTNLAGRGAGGATIGADIIYRYQDGVLTNEPLWPWPMENRIRAESGVSVTWKSAGGIWRTLDKVYPSPPRNLRIE